MVNDKSNPENLDGKTASRVLSAVSRIVNACIGLAFWLAIVITLAYHHHLLAGGRTPAGNSPDGILDLVRPVLFPIDTNLNAWLLAAIMAMIVSRTMHLAENELGRLQRRWTALREAWREKNKSRPKFIVELLLMVIVCVLPFVFGTIGVVVIVVALAAYPFTIAKVLKSDRVAQLLAESASVLVALLAAVFCAYKSADGVFSASFLDAAWAKSYALHESFGLYYKDIPLTICGAGLLTLLLTAFRHDDVIDPTKTIRRFHMGMIALLLFACGTAIPVGLDLLYISSAEFSDRCRQVCLGAGVNEGDVCLHWRLLLVRMVHLRDFLCIGVGGIGLGFASHVLDYCPYLLSDKK